MYFVEGLYSSEVKVKQNIIEILAAESQLYEDGHQYVMDALYDYQVNILRGFLEIQEKLTSALWLMYKLNFI